MSKSAPKVVLKRLDWLKPHPKNAKTHPAEQVAELVASIGKFGWTQPILAREDGTIIAGHGRLAAARQLAMKQVPVITIGGDWSETELRAYLIADNKLAENGGWDMKLLTAELSELKAADLLGFTGVGLQEFESLTVKLGDGRKKTDGFEFIPSAYDVLVTCAGELSQRQLLEKLTAEGFKCRALVR
jgi:ParB-like chromosome segregation protein Spo0J